MSLIKYLSPFLNKKLRKEKEMRLRKSKKKFKIKLKKNKKINQYNKVKQ